VGRSGCPLQACSSSLGAYRAGSLPIGAVWSIGPARLSAAAAIGFRVDAETPERAVSGHRLAHAEVNALISVDHAR